jgi:hypothetical protein
VEAGPGDGAKARALAALLGDPAEFAHAARLAEAALREPARWAQVGALAAALEAAGHVEAGIRGFLPAADPAWPPAPAGGVDEQALASVSGQVRRPVDAPCEFIRTRRPDWRGCIGFTD